MSSIETIYGCELISQDLLHQLEKHDTKTPEWGRIYLELLEHLAYTQMILERYLADFTHQERVTEAARLQALMPTFERLKNECAVRLPDGSWKAQLR